MYDETYILHTSLSNASSSVHMNTVLMMMMMVVAEATHSLLVA